MTNTATSWDDLTWDDSQPAEDATAAVHALRDKVLVDPEARARYDEISQELHKLVAIKKARLADLRRATSSHRRSSANSSA